MSRFHRPNIGSIGTAGYRDDKSLAQSFIGELRQQQPLHESDRSLLRKIDDFGTAFGYPPDIIANLVHALSRYAPKGYHFGPSDSDPSDFGYWPDEEHDRNEGSLEAEQRRESEETIAAKTAERFIASEFQQQ